MNGEDGRGFRGAERALPSWQHPNVAGLRTPSAHTFVFEREHESSDPGLVLGGVSQVREFEGA